MGPDDGETHDGIPYWYYFLFPFVCCIRLAQPLISIFTLLFSLTFYADITVDTNTSILWIVLAFFMECEHELSCWFHWLIWTATYFIGYHFSSLFVVPLASFYSVFGYSSLYSRRSFTPSSRPLKRRSGPVLGAFDRRLLLFSAYMLFEHMSPFFSSRCLGNSYYWFPFQADLMHRYVSPFQAWCLKRKPPWPPPGPLSHGVGIGLFCGYFSMVVLKILAGSVLVFFYGFRAIFDEQFYDCLEFDTPKLVGDCFFDAIEFGDEFLARPADNLHATSLEYSLILPEYQQTYLSALSYGSEHGAFVSFDLDSTHCVVDNCANVHIWNELNDFVQGSYVAFDQDLSTGVSAVNGASNNPAGIGNVRVSWLDDEGKEHKF